jgi:nitrite reductase (NO-forming)
MQTCFVCHQIEGEGIVSQIPPLANADYLMADKERSIRIVLQGMTGEVEVNGRTYNNVMMPLNNLSDQEIANVLTYVRNSWGNEGEAVTPEEVRRVRAELPATNTMPSFE